MAKVIKGETNGSIYEGLDPEIEYDENGDFKILGSGFLKENILQHEHWDIGDEVYFLDTYEDCDGGGNPFVRVYCFHPEFDDFAWVSDLKLDTDLFI